MAGTPFVQEKTHTVILSASRLYCAALFGKENGIHTFSIEFLTHTEVLGTPANIGCSVAHQLQENLQRKIPSAPSGLPGQSPVRQPKIAQKYNEGRFSTQYRSKPRNVSDDHTESSGHVHALRCCHGVVATDVLSVLEAGCCKDAADFAFFCGRTPKRNRSLVLPANN